MGIDNSVVVYWTPYKRKWLNYESTIRYSHKGVNHTIVCKFDLLAYHLIKWFHGEKVFDQMIEERLEKVKRDIRNGQ